MGDALLPIETEFRHLSLVQEGVEELVIEFFGTDSQLKYTGYFEAGSQTLMKNQEGT